MNKAVVFCADGTWNNPGEDEDDDGAGSPTNVFKLFANLEGVDRAESLRLSNEQERVLTTADGVAQVAKYLHGVGDSRNFLVKILGGTLGAGIIGRIVRGYTFISRNYRPGDKIFITGFSRGAYTARALAGLIAGRGLLDADQIDLDEKERAYRLGTAVWYDYRRDVLRRRDHGLLGRFAALFDDLPAFVTKAPTDQLIADVPIEAIGVWDTVGALGIPAYVRGDERVDMFRFADTTLSARVNRAFHAVAVDERRVDFTPTWWDADATRISQTLFPGAHADVGGGYASNESGLSDAALRWMISNLEPLGLRFRVPPQYAPRADAGGIAHDPCATLPWKRLPKGPRLIPRNLRLHRSVLTRAAAAEVQADPSVVHAPYRPSNLGAYLDGQGRALPGVEIDEL